jgi:hypothetical protein
MSRASTRRVIMMLDGEHQGAKKKAERRIDAADTIVGFNEGQPTPLGRRDGILKVLTRDDALRVSYVRRRWRGLTR